MKSVGLWSNLAKMFCAMLSFFRQRGLCLREQRFLSYLPALCLSR